jgi:anion transporter
VISYAEYADLLRRVDLFAGLDRVHLAKLAAHLDVVPVEASAVVCRQGEPGDALYVIARGRFGVYARSPAAGAEVPIRTLGPGDFFGEMALITGAPRSATVRAEHTGVLLRLDRASFLNVWSGEPPVGLAVAAALSRRVDGLTDNLRESRQALTRALDRALAALPARRQRRVRRAGLLAEPTPEALAVVFRRKAPEVAADLAAVAGPDLELLPMLRALPLSLGEGGRTVGPHSGPAADVGAAPFARRASARLAAAGRWGDALAVLEAHAPREAFLATLAAAAEAGAAPDGWLGRVTDAEAARWPALAPSAPAERGASSGADAPPVERAERMAVGRARASPALALGDAGRSTGAIAPSALPSARLRRLVPWLAAVALVAAALASANPRWSYLGLLGAAVVVLAATPAPHFAVGLGLAAGLVLLGLADPAAALGGFASEEWTFMLAVFCLASAVARSGLLLRASLLLVRRLPGTLLWQAATLMVTGVLLSPLLPSNNARAALVAPLGVAVADAERLRERGPAAAVLGMASWVGAGPLMFLFLNGSSTCLLAWGLLPEVSRRRIGWVQWLVGALPLGVLVGVGALALLFAVFRPRSGPRRTTERVALQLRVLGPPARQELAMGGLLALTVAGWVVAPLLRVDHATVALVAVLGAAAVGAFDARALRELDWDTLVLYGVLLGLAKIGVGLGIDRLAAQLLAPLLGPFAGGAVPFLLAVAALNLLARLVLDPVQVLLLFGLGLVATASAIGVEPWVVVLVLLATSITWFFPTQTRSYLVAYSATEGRLFSHRQARTFGLAYAGWTLAAIVACVPYWRALGML